MNNQYTSTRSLNAAQTWELMRIGMSVEYSDPKNDMDSGNFGTVLYRDLQRKRNAMTGQGYYLFNIQVQLGSGREVTISAGQILAYSKEECYEEQATEVAPVVEQVPAAELVSRPTTIKTVSFEMGGKKYQTRSSWDLLG